MESWGVPVLFVATVVNSLPVVSFLVPTEPAYLYIGTQLANGTGWASLIACMLGAWIGNQGAFWLGRTAGARVVNRMKVAGGVIERTKERFDRAGARFVVVAQLIWPIATLAQVMAGVWGMRPRTYLVASFFGAVLAIAQYAAVGYLSAVGLRALGLEPEESILAWLGPYLVLIGFVALLALGTAIVLSKGRGALPLRAAYAGLLGVGMLVAVNLGTLTGRTGEVALDPVPLETACRALNETLIARTGPTPLHQAQPINLVLLGIDDPGAVLERLGWLRNATYAADDLDGFDILRLTLRGVPPAATLELDGTATALAWQEERGAVPRTQLRLWPVAVPDGSPSVYLGSVARVDEITLRLSGRVPNLAYDLRAGIDTARDQEAALIAGAVPGASAELIGPDNGPVSERSPDTDPFEGAPVSVTNEFFSDGRAVEVRVEGVARLAEVCGSVR